MIGPNDLASSYPLMESSDIGLVYTSTTGLELALAGTPVVVAGETHYRGKGFTTDVSSPEEFVRVLDSALHDPASLLVDVPEARRYAHFFFFGRRSRRQALSSRCEALPVSRFVTLRSSGRAPTPRSTASAMESCSASRSFGRRRTTAGPRAPERSRHRRTGTPCSRRWRLASMGVCCVKWKIAAAATALA